jgi:probable HAF family extracellular repeat protein
MKSRLLFFLSWVGLLVLPPLSPRLAAQAQNPTPPRYTVTDLGTLGGMYSYAYGINNAGVIAGAAATPTQSGGISQTAFLWDDDLHTISLGTLGGSGCPDCSSEAGGPNAKGVSPILSETGEIDPNGEDFCAFGTHRQCLAAIWKSGTMTALSNLKGGNNGQAYWTNNHGQTVGLAENGTADSTCSTGTPFQVLRFEAVVWEPNGKIRELRPLQGDTVGYAFGINENGQAVGVTGLCSNTQAPPIVPGTRAPHAVLWEKDGTPVYLGSLSGNVFTIPADINDSGVVAGASLYRDGTIHPFLWTREKGIQDLGTFPGAFLTGIPCCHTLNNKGDAVGLTVDGTTFNMRAVLFHDNQLFDLNTLIPSNSGWYLQFGGSINDAGEIVGWGTINGNTHAFLATPCYRDQTDSQCRDISVADDKSNDTALVPTTANVPDLREVRSRFGRLGALLEGSR